MRSRIRGEVNRSAGLAVAVPAGSNCKPGTSGIVVSAGAAGLASVIQSLKPATLGTPNSACWRGFRRSQSTRIVRRPPWAITTARLARATLLPSSAEAEVTTRVCSGFSRPAKIRLLRSVRKASATGEFGCDRVRSEGVMGDAVPPKGQRDGAVRASSGLRRSADCGPRSAPTGSAARTGRPSPRSRSCRVRT